MIDRRTLLRSVGLAVSVTAFSRATALAEPSQFDPGAVGPEVGAQAVEEPAVPGWDMWFDAAVVGGRVVFSDMFLSVSSTHHWSHWDPSLIANDGMVTGSGNALVDSGIADGVVDVTFVAGEEIGIDLLPRYVDGTNCVYATIRSRSVEVRARVNGIDTQLGAVTRPEHTAGAYYRYRVEFVSGSYSVTGGSPDALDSGPILTVTDPIANFAASTLQGFRLAGDMGAGITSVSISTATPNSNDRVSAWPDLGPGIGPVATQAVLDRRPFYRSAPDGARTPSLYFTDSSVLSSGIAADVGKQTVFVVADIPDLPDAAGAFIAGQPMGGLELRLQPNGSLEALVTMKSSIGASVAAMPTRQTVLIALSYHSGTGEFQFYIDGLPSEPSGYLGRHVTPLPGSGGSVAIGAVTSGIDALKANVHEIVRYGRCLRGDEIASVTVNLAKKHDIRLQPMLSTPPMSVFPRASSESRLALRGGNISPTAANFYTGGVADNENVWAQLWYEWDWTDWIQRNIDLAKGLGANTIRMIGDMRGIRQGSTARSTYLDRLRQLVEYLGSQDMYLYATSGDLRQLDGVDEMFVTAELQAQADLLKDYSNVVGWDVMQEIGSSFKTVGKQRCAEWARNWASAIRDVAPGIPLTYSSVSYMWDVATYREFDEFVDYFDLHMYSTPTAPLGNQSIAPLLSITSKPVMIGEFGADVRTLPRQQAVDAYEVALNLVTDNPQVVGANCWSIMNDATGIYDASGRTLRTELAEVFSRFPTTR